MQYTDNTTNKSCGAMAAKLINDHIVGQTEDSYFIRAKRCFLVFSNYQNIAVKAGNGTVSSGSN